MTKRLQSPSSYGTCTSCGAEREIVYEGYIRAVNHNIDSDARDGKGRGGKVECVVTRKVPKTESRF